MRQQVKDRLALGSTIVFIVVVSVAAFLVASYVNADSDPVSSPASIATPGTHTPEPAPTEEKFQFRFHGLTLALDEDGGWTEDPEGDPEEFSRTLQKTDEHGVTTDLSFYNTRTNVGAFEQNGHTTECIDYSDKADGKVGSKAAFYYVGWNCGPDADQIHRIWLVPGSMVIVAASEFGGDPTGETEGDLHHVKVLLRERVIWTSE